MTQGGDEDFKSLLRDLTECPICRETLADPKTLPCLHTFCCACLSDHCRRSIQPGSGAACPLCRQQFTLPTGGCAELQTDFRIRQFSDLKKAAKSIRPANWRSCDRCAVASGDGASAAAVLSCPECHQLFCGRCGDEHRSVEPSHNLVSLDRRSCNRHPNRQIDIYCNDCDEPGCTACRLGPHHGHRIADLHEVTSTFRHILRSNSVDAASRLATLKSAGNDLDSKKVFSPVMLNEAKTSRPRPRPRPRPSQISVC